MSSRRARGGGGVFNKLQKRNGGRGDEFTVREGGGTVRSLAGLRSHKSTNIGRFDLLLLPGPARCPRSCSWTKNVSFSVTQTCNH